MKDLLIGGSIVLGGFLALMLAWIVGLCISIGIPVVVVVLVLRWLGVIS